MSQAAIDSRSAMPSPTTATVYTAAAIPDWRYHAILLALCAGVLLAATLLSVRDRSQVVLPLVGLPLPELCTMRRLLHIDCPGCGLTRCFISLAHGHLREAWSYNPAGLWLFLLMAIQIPYRGWQLWRIGRGQREIALPWLTVVAFAVLAVALLAQWSLRLAGVSF
jgi:uncharacterized protein DUF2752